MKPLSSKRSRGDASGLMICSAVERNRLQRSRSVRGGAAELRPASDSVGVPVAPDYRSHRGGSPATAKALTERIELPLLWSERSESTSQRSSRLSLLFLITVLKVATLPQEHKNRGRLRDSRFPCGMPQRRNNPGFPGHSMNTSFRLSRKQLPSADLTITVRFNLAFYILRLSV
jgi:hypothetical protein